VIIFPFLPRPRRRPWPWLAGSAAVHILYFVFLAGAYRYGELSYVYPIMRGGGPMIVAASGAAVFAETLTGGQWLGVLLVCGGIVAFASALTTAARPCSRSPTRQ
jgi:multidrug transporter EmrE-like cation transporter